jgi:DNA-binding NtrC family response regulator
MSAKGPPARFDGISDAIRKLQEEARKIAKLPFSILITGEKGTGKTSYAVDGG